MMRTVQLLVILFLSSLFVLGCVPLQRLQTNKIYWPKPPDKPRYIYETTLRSSKNIKIQTQQDRFQSLATGLSAKKIGSFAKPYDVAARGGKIVVTDTVTRLALMFDIPRQRLFAFGKRREGELKKPMGVAMDANQFIYIADISDNRVKVYDPLGRFLRKIGELGEFDRAVDVAVSDSGERIYVVDAGGIDSNKHRITIFDRAGKRLSVIGQRGSEEGQFNLPIQAVVASDGSLYVLDAGNFRVQVFDADGKFLRAWGKVGRAFGDFARPRGIALDQDGNVYVTDATFRNFQIFSPTGQLLMAIGNTDVDDKPGQYVLPAGIAVDETNRVYIIDQMMRKIDVIRKLTEAEIAAFDQPKSSVAQPGAGTVSVDTTSAPGAEQTPTSVVAPAESTVDSKPVSETAEPTGGVAEQDKGLETPVTESNVPVAEVPGAGADNADTSVTTNTRDTSDTSVETGTTITQQGKPAINSTDSDAESDE